MKLDDQLRLATWLLAEGEAYKAKALDLPSSRAFFGERMRWNGAAEACFTICKEVLRSDFNEVIYAEPKANPPEGDADQAPVGGSDLYQVGEESVS